MTKIDRDYGNGNLQTAYEYGYSSDGAKVWKRDTLSQQEYRYLCRIGCGGVPMRVYRKAVSEMNWASVEDYLSAGNALGYGANWRFHYAGGTVLMMGITGEPNSYHPTDSNGVAVQSHPPMACLCVAVPAQVATCDALGYGGCEEGGCFMVSEAFGIDLDCVLKGRPGNILCECKTPNCNGDRVNCEECNDAMRKRCILARNHPETCRNIATACQSLCLQYPDHPEVGTKVWLCWVLSWPR